MTTSGEKMRREKLNNDNHIIMNYEISFYIVLSLKYLFMQYFSLTFCKEKYLRLLFYDTDILIACFGELHWVSVVLIVFVYTVLISFAFAGLRLIYPLWLSRCETKCF